MKRAVYMGPWSAGQSGARFPEAQVQQRVRAHLGTRGWAADRRCRAVRGLQMWGYECYGVRSAANGVVVVNFYSHPASGCWYFERPAGLCSGHKPPPG